MAVERRLDSHIGSNADSESALKDEGLKLAYAKDPTLQRYVSATKQAHLGSWEAIASEVFLTGAAISLLTKSPAFLGRTALTTGLLTGAKAGWDLYNGVEDANKAGALMGAKYRFVQQSGRDVISNAELTAGAMGMGVGAIIGTLHIVPNSESLIPLALLSVGGIQAYGLIAGEKEVKNLDHELDLVAKKALRDQVQGTRQSPAVQDASTTFTSKTKDSGAAAHEGVSGVPGQTLNSWPINQRDLAFNPYLRAALQGPSQVYVSEAPQTNSADKLTIIDRTPAFRGLTTVNGERFDISSLLAKGPVVLDFGASWCPPCRQAMPELEQLRQSYESKGISFVFVDEQDNLKDLQKLRSAQGAKMNVAVDADGSLMKAFGVNGLPQTIVIEQNGMVHQMQAGYSKEMKSSLSHQLDAIIAGKGPAQA
ncbi:MAG TPA: TlpA disulfide reductase family protein [Planktothrix sp.]|jgi:thiol-disulfide isomerase/thioredoxin